jgi:aspartyl/asparaginyl beta-hydroxylase (cupin superfamily)
MNEPEVKPKPTYMIYGGRFTGQEPCFYDPAQFSWVKLLEDNWLVIREEIQSLLERREERLKPYFINSMSFPPGQWKTLGLYFWKYKQHQNCLECPQTVRLLESIPHMTGGSLSVLEAGSNINPHQGDTNAIIRVHLGLTIPAPLPDCGFQVGREVRQWEEGKALLFCDAHSHLAWNRSDRRRLLLIVDVMRPEFVEQTDAICTHVLATMIVQRIYQHSAFLKRLPGRFKYGIHFVIRSVMRVLLPVQRRAGFLFKLTRG